MQLDLGLNSAGLKAQVRAMAPKSAGIAKLLLFKAILAKRKLFLIIHELSVPAQTAVNGSLMQVREEFRTLLPGNVVTLR